MKAGYLGDVEKLGQLAPEGKVYDWNDWVRTREDFWVPTLPKFILEVGISIFEEHP